MHSILSRIQLRLANDRTNEPLKMKFNTLANQFESRACLIIWLREVAQMQKKCRNCIKLMKHHMKLSSSFDTLIFLVQAKQFYFLSLNKN